MNSEFCRNFAEKQIWKLKKFSSLGFVVKLTLSILTGLIVFSKVFELKKHTSFHLVIFALAAVFVIIFSIWSIKSWMFTPKEQWRTFVDQYYSALFDFIQEENTEITSIWPIRKTDVRIINHSGIIHCCYEELESQNLFKGNFGNNPFELSEIDVAHLFKSKFKGFFCYVEYEVEIESSFGSISEYIEKIFEKYKGIAFDELILNSRENILFFAIRTNRKLFGCKEKRKIRKLQTDIEYFNNMFAFLREAASCVA
ncbi:MAG: hypothetical protein CVU11_04840 [Bacteroidetes bacterium HGW-Bacteroidetes-6]|jgi:hypothetical protein|nr:MAG: hypothetical protein CVU11_04840 [Bacteroidetes bacterium HGW-Bacteroidetes-6]